MPESSTIMGLVGAFIAIAIMLNIGVQILGNVQTATNCANLPGNAGIHQTTANATGWALQCLQQNTNAQSAYTLLGVILIVVAAVAILFVVRLL